MNEYYIIDLTADNRNGVLTLFGRDLESRTTALEKAGRVPEQVVNNDLDRFDNGSSTRAILTSSLAQASETVVPIHNVKVSVLLTRNNNIPTVRRQAL